jgi:hypothetical protein
MCTRSNFLLSIPLQNGNANKNKTMGAIAILIVNDTCYSHGFFPAS